MSEGTASGFRRRWEREEVRQIEAGGIPIAHRRFAPRGAGPTRRLFLLHGGRAHSGWWRWVVDELPVNYDVIVPDLSGHGLSGHRVAYTPDAWAEEIEALADATEWHDFAIAGHSMGGKVGVAVARRSRVETLVLVDTPFSDPDHHDPFPTPPVRTKRVYETYEDAVAHFHVTPDQPVDDPERLLLIAADAIRPEGEGWTWRFDPDAYRIFDDAEVLSWIGELECSIGYVRATRSALTTAGTAQLVERHAMDVRVHELASAFHHAPIDSPVQTAAAIVLMMEGGRRS